MSPSTEQPLISLVKVCYNLMTFTPLNANVPGIVNPIGQICSTAMMLRYSCGMEKEAKAVETAVDKVLDSKEIGGFEIRTR